MRRKLYASAIAATVIGGVTTGGLVASASVAAASPTPIPFVCQSEPWSPLATGADWPHGVLLQVCVDTPLYAGFVTVATADGGYVIAQSPSSYIGVSGHDGGIVDGGGLYDTTGPNQLLVP
jgi:hypothetical protein